MVAVAASVLATGCFSGNDSESATSAAPGGKRRASGAGSDRGGPARPPRALQRIADENGGTRASGTPGYDASVEYVAEQLRRAGYSRTCSAFVTRTRTSSPRPSSPALSPDPLTYRYPDDFVSLRYSGSGEVEAPLEAIDAYSETSGCDSSDFDDFDTGAIALIRRGGCFFAEKVRNASGREQPRSSSSTTDRPGTKGRSRRRSSARSRYPHSRSRTSSVRRLPSKRTPGPSGCACTRSVEVGQTETANVLADLPGATKGAPLLLGAHLDSIESGPGINDNGSGVATLLELAVQARKLDFHPQRPVRFAFWAGEEAGEFGSREYVKSLENPIDDIAFVVNLDMVGSPNPEPFVYEGDGTIQEALSDAVRDEGLDPTHGRPRGTVRPRAVPGSGRPDRRPLHGSRRARARRASRTTAATTAPATRSTTSTSRSSRRWRTLWRARSSAP